jgi:hypothetical protein
MAHIARLDATILRIHRLSVRIRRILGRIAGREKNTDRLFMELRPSVAALHLTRSVRLNRSSANPFLLKDFLA